MQKSLNQLLYDSSAIFWDFDGVIKDSVALKASAYELLFPECDKKILNVIRTHHLENGGLSRFEKIPFYLSLAGLPSTSINIKIFCEKFSIIVKQSVIDCPWVPGIIEYIESNYKNKKFIIITATPKDEIDEILMKLGISNYFLEVYGSPTLKCDAMSMAMAKFKCVAENTVMIGDSMSDYNAAVKNNIPFVLKQTEFNLFLQNELPCVMFRNFINE